MVPDPNSADEDGEASALASDGDAAAGFDEAALYTVVRDAVGDALLDVIGTLLLLGIAFVLVVAGGRALVASTDTLATTAGVAVAAAGLYLAAATLELVPPVREWL